jgi:hypothetical protein
VLAAASGAILVARRRFSRSSRSQPDSPNGK